jgi:hypothetical protein
MAPRRKTRGFVLFGPNIGTAAHQFTSAHRYTTTAIPSFTGCFDRHARLQCHHIASRQDLCTGTPRYETVQEFAVTLSACSRGHAFVRDDAWHHVCCFRERADAENSTRALVASGLPPCDAPVTIVDSCCETIKRAELIFTSVLVCNWWQDRATAPALHHHRLSARRQADSFTPTPADCSIGLACRSDRPAFRPHWTCTFVGLGCIRGRRPKPMRLKVLPAILEDGL